MRVIKDKNGVLWYLDQFNCYVVFKPLSFHPTLQYTVIESDFDGFAEGAAKEFDKVLGNINMRIKDQVVVYELTLTELKELLAEKLGISSNKIKYLDFKMVDKNPDGPSHLEVSGLELTVSKA